MYFICFSVDAISNLYSFKVTYTGLILQDRKQHAEPMSLFEQFFIVGLNSDTNVVAAVEDALAKGNTWNSKMAKSEIQDLKNLQCQQGSLPPLEPQVDYMY